MSIIDLRFGLIMESLFNGSSNFYFLGFVKSFFS